MRTLRAMLAPLLAMTGLLATSSGQATSVYLSPATASLDLASGTATFGLYVDFTDDPTIGGGLDFDFRGAIALQSFLPSPFFNSLDTEADDTDFTGFGTARADADLEIHLGALDGFSGINKLGDFTVNLLSVGSGAIDVGINSAYGSFCSTALDRDCTCDSMVVDLYGAAVEVVASPGSGTAPTSPPARRSEPQPCPPPPPWPPVPPPDVVFPPVGPMPGEDGWADTLPDDYYLPLPASAPLLATAFAIAACRRRQRSATLAG
jgi:hypothetical protein